MKASALFTVSVALIASLQFAVGDHHEAKDAPWKPLVQGDSFDGWKQLGGKAKYEIKDGVVTGTSVRGTPNSFLTTVKHYADFELEYEFKVAEQLNSGVQIRSNSFPDYKNGRVHGYQVEIDPDVKRNRMWTAGIYDEGRRGWLNDLKNNDAARKAFKPDAWNHVRVLAVGDHIRTWLNGVAAADLRDSMTQSGFIGLQVHGIGRDPKKEGLQVQWRQLKIRDLGKHVWKPLFNGKDTSGWRALPGGAWEVADGAIKGTSPKSEPKHGILLSEKSFGDFAVRLKFRVAKGDSGFYWRAQPVKSNVGVTGFQVEVDTSDETGGLYETGGRGWVVKPEAPNKLYKKGEWNELAVSAHGDRIHVFLNNRESARLDNDERGNKSGHFGLQLHGGQDMEVYYKDIEILTPQH